MVSVAFSPDCRIVLTGGEDRTTQLWVTYTGKPVYDAIEHDSHVREVEFIGDGSRFLVSRDSGVVDIKLVPILLPDEAARIKAWIQFRTAWTRGERAIHRRLRVEEWSPEAAVRAGRGSFGEAEPN